MNFVPPRITRIVASAAMLSILSIGCMTGAAEASTGAAPTAISIKAATAPSPSTDAYTAQVLKLINEKRAAVGSSPVKWNQQIGNVSQDWSAHLGEATKSDTFDWNTIHRSDAGGSLIPSGATWYREIVGFNGSAQSIVDWWMGSASHKAAMLDPKATDIGIGYVVPTSGPYTGWHMVVSNLAAYPQAQAPSSGTQYKTTIQLNYRTGGGFEYPVIDSVPTGTIVTATGKANGVWYEVKVGNQIGWMSSDYLTKYVSPTPTTPTKSALATKVDSLNGGLGSATSGEVYGLKDGGGYQNFQRGAVVWSPATGAHISMGAVRNLWLAVGAENSGLGYPTSDEIADGRGGVYQTFQNGAIVYSPTIGATISIGAIRNLWLSTGGINGGMGYPTSNEISDGRGGVYQTYQSGAIVYSPTIGATISFGGIRNIWLSTGGVNGRLGYPTSNEYGTSAGNVAQNYEGGTIKWGSAGNFIVYK